MQIAALVPMLGVADDERSLAFYRGTLGFAVVGDNRRDGRLTWMFMRRGRAEVMLTGPVSAVRCEEVSEVLGHVLLYINIDDCAALREEWVGNGAACTETMPTFYGMLEFSCEDPDGHTIVGGEEIRPDLNGEIAVTSS